MERERNEGEEEKRLKSKELKSKQSRVKYGNDVHVKPKCFYGDEFFSTSSAHVGSCVYELRW